MSFSSDEADPTPVNESHESNTEPSSGDETSQKSRLIGSQRDSVPYRPKPVISVVDSEGRPLDEKPLETLPVEAAPEIPKSEAPVSPPDDVEQPVFDKERLQRVKERGKSGRSGRGRDDEPSAASKAMREIEALRRPGAPVPVPAIRGDLDDDLEEEYAAMLGDAEMESLFRGVDDVASQTALESESKHQGKILSVTKENVFVELGGREQGIVPLKQFKTEPVVGEKLDVIVVRFLPEEGLYDLSLPLAASDVSDWSQIEYGMILEAKVTGHNAGGLECEVNRIRGFIPASQIALYRVEKLEEFVGQKLTCLVTECNPAKRNLVLSHRSILEREREENRQKLLQELEVGQIRDGVIRKLIDAGAFVDLGGVDGFIPIGAMAWGRIKHPNEVLQEGQAVKVKIQKVDTQTGRISLAYREDSANPWLTVDTMFPEKSVARGKVSKIMEFGAFIELMPGLEGLVHISELAHRRVNRVSEVLQEGDWVDVYVQAIDTAAKRISLSIKQLSSAPEPVKTEAEQDDEPEVKPAPIKIKNQHKGPLKGGVERKSDGDKFGLKF